MGIQDIVNFSLRRCSFSKGGYTFEFGGKINNQFRTYLVNTSFYFSLPGDKLVDSGENFSADVWEFLEKKVTAVSVVENELFAKVVFDFEDGCQFIIFHDGPLTDNLIIVRIKETDEWFPVC